MSLLKQTFTEEQIKEFGKGLPCNLCLECDWSSLWIAEEWKAKKQKPHPMFKTTASEIGTAPIGVTPELKPPAHPRTGTFSKVKHVADAF